MVLSYINKEEMFMLSFYKLKNPRLFYICTFRSANYDVTNCQMLES